MAFLKKDHYEFTDLVEIMKLLRSPDGCPWDREQNHESIRQNFIEETYEVIEAIDTNDTDLLKEELGDVLLQVVFHSQMEAELDSFDVNDVCDGVCKKLIIRHPHVFADVTAENSEEVLNNWDKIKMKTKKQDSYSEAMESVSKSLPSLMRSAKIQQKASKVGFDWGNPLDAALKIDEELAEFREALSEENQAACEEEIGDLLFAVVNVARLSKIDAEKALYNACDKFTCRFKKMEQLAKKRGLDLKALSLEELDNLWTNVKYNRI